MKQATGHLSNRQPVSFLISMREESSNLFSYTSPHPP
jgi:hypothetical protein